MKVWLWPFNWYCRIRDLERQNAALRAINSEMESRLRAQMMVDNSMFASYNASLMAMASQYEQLLKTRR